MWTACPVGLLARSHRIEERGRTIGTIEFGTWSERGALELEGRRLVIRREGYWNPKFELLDGREVLGRGRSAGAFRRGYCLVWGDEEYRLDPASVFGRSYVLTRRGHHLGTIQAAGIFSRRLHLELDEELPPALRLFALWFVLLAQRRAAAASVAT
jgi:hypothetical protein